SAVAAPVAGCIGLVVPLSSHGRRRDVSGQPSGDDGITGGLRVSRSSRHVIRSTRHTYRTARIYLVYPRRWLGVLQESWGFLSSQKSSNAFKKGGFTAAMPHTASPSRVAGCWSMMVV